MPKKTKADPTGQAVNRNKATRQLVNRLTHAEREVKALFRAVPRTTRRQTKVVNAEQETVYSYDFDYEEFAALSAFAINQSLLETQTNRMPFDWYYRPTIELPYRQGTVEEVRDFNALVASAITAGVLVAGLPPETVAAEQVLISTGYRLSVSKVQAVNFSVVKGLSEKTATQVLGRVNDGIEAGESPTAIAEDITKRFDVAKSDAKRIAHTEVNKAYNDAKLKATDMLAQRTGLRAGVIHISALTPTTRTTHADRHGNAYTTSDQTGWWNEGANRINCKCSTRTILIDRSGNVVDVAEQDVIKAERSFFS